MDRLSKAISLTALAAACLTILVFRGSADTILPGPIFILASTAANTCTNIADSSDNTTVAGSNFGANGRQYYGLSRYTPTSNLTVCAIAFKINGTTGIGTNLFTAFIGRPTNSPNFNLDLSAGTGGKMAESTTTLGDVTWTNVWITNTFTVPFVLTNGSVYMLLWGPQIALGANGMFGYVGTNTVMSGYKDYFNGTTGAASDAGGNDPAIKIFGQ